MLYGTTGTTVYYDYTSFSVKGNVLTCKYEEAYGYDGRIEEIEPGSHQYVLNEDGSITAENHIWYRRKEESAQENVRSRVLLSVRDLDFPCGDYTADTTFLGVQELSRRSIEKIVFLDTLEGTPEYTWDVSEAQDGSVELWMERGNNGCQVFIAANGGVIANYCSNDLFRLCTNLTEIDFNAAFDVSGTSDFSHMFRDCRNLSSIRGMNFWDTAAAYDMNSMFRGCENVRELDLRDFTTDGVWDMSRMFYGCRNLESLRIENLVLEGTTVDIFTGTRWEDSSPLLDYSASGVSTACILNTDISIRDPRLRAPVITEYDNILKELSKGRINSWGAWLYTNYYIFYSMQDINGDGIPELIVRTDTEGVYKFTLYYFDVASCTARMVRRGSFQSDWPELYLYPDEHILSCYGSAGDCIFKMEDSEVYELSNYNVSGLWCETLDYTFVKPDCIEYCETDLLGDGSENTVEIYGLTNPDGCYNYIGIYVDSTRIFGKKLNGRSSWIDQEMFYIERTEKNNPEETEADDEAEEADIVKRRADYFYIHIGSVSSSEYTAVLEYDNNSLSEKLILSDFIDETQLRGDDNNNSYFSVSVGSDGELKVTFYLNTYGLGEELEFSVDFDAYVSSEFCQRTFIADIDDIWFESQNVTAKKKFCVYKRVGETEEAYTVNAGDTVQYDKIWLSNGYIWVRVENILGQKGWIPAGREVLLQEVPETEEVSLESGILDMSQHTEYFNLDMPAAEILYQLGIQYYSEEDYDTAEIYFDLIQEESSCYELAQEWLAELREMRDSRTEEDGVYFDESKAEETGEFIFADSDSRYLTVEDLKGLDAQTLRCARNEIYARHGRRFNDQELQSYFDGKSWYQGTIEPEEFQESMLSDIERKNAELILHYENGEG
ncbi:MAG: YARHG domain-containing protein [Lachnospiraceae bacterium]|nr:YARHG domain-containing protein [Lachnospiraceae bacterium]